MDLVSRWNDILRALSDRSNDRSLGQHLADIACNLLQGNHASISLTDQSQFFVFDSTDALARRLDEDQATIGHGPIFSVTETGTPTVVANTADRPTFVRWPAFGPVLSEAGIGSLLCYPLVSGGARVGSVTSYRDTPWSPDPDTYTDGLLLAALTTEIVLQAQAGALGDELSIELRPSLRDRAVIQQAAGITAEQLGISIGEAMVRLRAHAFANNQTLALLARRVTSGETALEP